MAPATDSQTQDSASEVAILGCHLKGSGEMLSQYLALHYLEMKFSEHDQIRMRELASRNQAEALTEAERDEMFSYAKAGCLLGILQSKARKFLNEAENRKVR